MESPKFASEFARNVYKIIIVIMLTEGHSANRVKELISYVGPDFFTSRSLIHIQCLRQRL